MKNYRFGFDGWGLALFLAVMLPTFLWLAVPAPNDILRRESVTGGLDAAASAAQILFVAAMCLIVRRERKELRPTPCIVACEGCVLLYYAGWACYYSGIVGPLVIFALTVPPCAAFLLFAFDRKNFIALVPAGVFTVCHLIYAAVNFL